jgi:hypothetical protein
VRLLARFLQRLLILGLGILSIWMVVFVFRFVDYRRSWILALAFTYGIAAYIILPRGNTWGPVALCTYVGLRLFRSGSVIARALSLR